MIHPMAGAHIRIVRACLGVLLAIATMTACGDSSPKASPDIDTPDGLLAWIADNRDHVGLVIRRRHSEELALNADELFPLASTRKVLTLLALNDRLRAGTEQSTDAVALADVERFYWPGTDGGAHANALADLHQPLTLGDVAWAMIRHSDNAASDYLLQRVGGTSAVSAVASKYGMTRQEPLYSGYGQFVAWATEPDRWLKLTPAERPTEAARVADATPTADTKALRLPPVTRQRGLAQASVRGTPREWAMLMDQLPPDPFIEKTLGWPLIAFPSNKQQFATFETKGGSLPGVNTQASFMVPVHDSQPYAITLFFRDLPESVQAQFTKAFVQQTFVVKLATDDAFRDKVERTLS
jgi:D-alanyl-D-alanine carboxypeptidase